MSVCVSAGLDCTTYWMMPVPPGIARVVVADASNAVASEAKSEGSDSVAPCNCRSAARWVAYRPDGGLVYYSTESEAAADARRNGGTYSKVS